MRLSNVLLAAMLASTYGSLAQESNVKIDLDSIAISDNLNNSVEVNRDSLYHKKVALFYKKRKRKEKGKTKESEKAQQNIYAEKLRPNNYCPGCGRG